MREFLKWTVYFCNFFYFFTKKIIKKGDKNMSTTLLERFRKNVEAKKGEPEFLDASIEFLDDIEREIKEGIDAGKVLSKEEKKEFSEFYDYFTKTYLSDNSCFIVEFDEFSVCTIQRSSVSVYL